MSEFGINIKLTADGASLANGVRAAKAQIDGLTKSARDAAGAVRILGDSTRRTTQATQQQSRAAQQARTAQTALNTATRQSVSATNSAANAFRNLGRAQQGAAGQVRGFSAVFRAFATDSRRVAPALQGVAGATRSAATETGRAGKVAGAAKDLFKLMGKQAGTAAAEMVGLSAGSVELLGALGRLALAGGPWGVAIGAVVAAIGGAIFAGVQYSENLKLINHTIERAGLQHQISADQIRTSTNDIAMHTGQSFGEVQKAQLGLIESGEISADKIDDVARAGAMMASTFGSDVVTGTNDVASAYTGLAEGDTSNLIEKFGFLEQSTLDQINALIKSGDTAAAQGVFMDALGGKLHGGNGSLSTAFGNLGGAIADWVGGMVHSTGIVQWFEGIIGGLARTIQRFAHWIRGNVPSEYLDNKAPKGPATIGQNRPVKAAPLPTPEPAPSMRGGGSMGNGSGRGGYGAPARPRVGGSRARGEQGSSGNSEVTVFADTIKATLSIVQEIHNEFSQIPDDIRKATDQTAQLDALIEKLRAALAKTNLNAKDRKEAEDALRQAMAARVEVQQQLSISFRQTLGQQTLEIHNNELILAGRMDQLSVEQDMRTLMELVGAQSREQLATILAQRNISADQVRQYFTQLATLRAQTAEIKRQEEAKTKATAARNEVKDNLRQGVGDLVQGKGINALGGVIERMFASVQEKLADHLFEKWFSPVFKEETAKSPEAARLKQAGDELAKEVDGASRDIKRLGTAAGAVADTIDPAIGNAGAATTGPTAAINQLANGVALSVGAAAKTLQTSFKDVAASTDEAGDEIIVTGRRFILDSTGDLVGTLKDIFARIFSDDFAAGLAETIGRAFEGAAVGQMVSGIAKSLGIKQSNTGAKIGGAIGNFIPGLPPGVGAAIGGFIGGTLGALFKGTKKGSSAVIAQDGGYAAGSAVGNSAAFRDQARGLAGNVASGLQNIAEQLGGIVSGAISVSLGVRNGKPVVDTTGRNRTKGAGVVKFGAGEESAAVAFAIADALKDGAIAGLSEKVKQALTSSTDIERALKEALKVDEIEQLLAGFGGAAKKSFVDFERQAKERLRIAGKYGFDLVKLEAENAKQRKALLDQSIENVTGGLKALLEDLISGEKAPGTLLDRREALLAKKVELEALAPTDAAAAQKLAEVLDQLYQVSLEAFGTAGAQFAGDRAGIKSTAEAIIAQATADLTAAQDRARANAGTDQASTDALITQSNGHLAGINGGMDEANAQLAQLISGVGAMNLNLQALGQSGVNYGALYQLGTGVA